MAEQPAPVIPEAETQAVEEVSPEAWARAEAAEAAARKPGRGQAILIRVIFLLLGLLALLGRVEVPLNRALAPVWDFNEAFLDRALTRSAGYLAALTLPKAALSVIETAVAEPEVAASKLGMLRLGAVAGPFKEIIDDLWDFMGLSTILIMVQIALIKMIKLTSIKVLVGLGGLLCAVNYARDSLFGKLGGALLILAATFYLVYPVSLRLSASAFQTWEAETAVRLEENLGALKEMAKDVQERLANLSLGNLMTDLRALLADLNQTLGLTLRTVWEMSLNYFIGVIIMFILVPLLSLGLVFFIARQALAFLDLPRASLALSKGAGEILGRVMPRTRRRLFP